MKKFLFHSQKYFYLAASLLLASGLPSYAQDAPQLRLGPNLLNNAGFENGTASWGIAGNAAKIISDNAHSGSHSFYYNNTNASQYKMFRQKVNTKPGQHLYFSAWIKGENVLHPTNKAEGASLFMESSANSTHLGGSYPKRLTGTFDWTQVTGEYTVPSDATTTTVGLYLRKGVTGSVWFDDVEVHIILPDAVSAWLQYPNYRGMLAHGDMTPWVCQLRIHKQDDWKPGSLKIATTLVDNHGKVLLEKSTEVSVMDEKARITIQPPPNLPVGKYTLKQVITNPNGKKELQNDYSLHVIEKMPTVYVDSQGFTILDGKRFFPMGVYLGAGTNGEEHLQRISSGGFNTVLSYSYGTGKDAETFMENAHKHGLKVVYSLKDMYPGKHGYKENAFDVAAKYITLMRNNPALLAWYTNDELDSHWMPYLQKTYDLVQDLDPNHPTYQVQNKTEELENNATVTDILGADPYPVGSANLSNSSRQTHSVQDAARGTKGIWIVPQLMDWAVYRKDNKPHPPSLDEMRNQAYQAIINGATGLIWYSYYDMQYEKYPRDKSTLNMDLFHRRWTEASSMAQEINGIVPVILKNDKVPLVLPTNAEVQAAAWQNGNELLIMLANPYYEQKSITLELPKGWTIKDVDQREIKSTSAIGKVTFTLPSVGSGVFRLIKN